MPNYSLLADTPAKTARLVWSAVLDSDSDQPLMDAAAMLLRICQQADAADPEWASFLQRMNRELPAAPQVSVESRLRDAQQTA